MVLILGIKIKNRNEDVLCCQKILTKYGCNIKTRLGLHHFQGDICAQEGIILLEMCDAKNENENMCKELLEITDLEIKSMEF